MNVFYLDKNPRIAAQYHNDSHVRKMIIELAQLLSTAHRVLDGEEYYKLSEKGRKIKRWKITDDDDGRNEVLYKATHVNHPSNKWVRASADHYYWTYELFDALGREFIHRWEKEHKTWIQLKGWLQSLPNNLKTIGWEEPPQAMNEEYRIDNDSINAYRLYYIEGKSHLAVWTKRGAPDWYEKITA